jgi:hypothetical protein
MGDACSKEAQLCHYEDANFDSGLTTLWDATCTDGVWVVVETTEPNGP